mgnify:CR=1 FL=1|tara:strand:+ start:1908 stop:2279 length:372 start_codon:yes stop_codon:yes gene_type:complete
MKTFEQFLLKEGVNSGEIMILKESLETKWTPELEYKVDIALEEFVKQYQSEDGTFDLEKLDNQMTNEGLMGTIFGGLAGFALGKSVGKTIGKILGLKEKGAMYRMLTSRIVGAALGAALGSKL